MGYTHYLRFKNVVTKERLSKASADVKKAFELIKAECPDIVIKDGWGENEPQIDENAICFNGDASKEEDFETFAVRVGEEGFNCCKTGRMPYDVYVCVACLILKEHFGDDLCMSSDGIFKDDRDRGVDINILLGGEVYRIDDDWQKPIELYKNFKGISK